MLSLIFYICKDLSIVSKFQQIIIIPVSVSFIKIKNNNDVKLVLDVHHSVPRSISMLHYLTRLFTFDFFNYDPHKQIPSNALS